VYHIGIDLGTTNCAFSYLSSAKPKVVSTLKILQNVTYDSVQALEQLPSFIFFSDQGQQFVGSYARQQQFTSPFRVVSSAKSWLSTPNLDRTAKILPWGFTSESLPDSDKISPVEALSIFLRSLRSSWEREPGLPSFNDQDIVITVPASYGPLAQELTLKAAELADYNLAKVNLLEEPIAAFLDLLENNKLVELKSNGKKNSFILVCDIGGGTTDFSIFSYDNTKSSLKDQISRIAVSNHILLGGDNLDLFIAHRLKDEFNLELTGKQFLCTLSQGSCLF
jgi:molecular chaperone DnaK (HSP70)